MLGYHRQARILGATRRHVNEIVVCNSDGRMKRSNWSLVSARHTFLPVNPLSRRQLSLIP